MTGSFKRGSYVVPTADGNYACPPATVIEAFWMWITEKASDGLPVLPVRTNKRLMYKQVDPITWAYISYEPKEMTEELWAVLVETRDHPHFIG